MRIRRWSPTSALAALAAELGPRASAARATAAMAGGPAAATYDAAPCQCRPAVGASRPPATPGPVDRGQGPENSEPAGWASVPAPPRPPGAARDRIRVRSAARVTFRPEQGCVRSLPPRSRRKRRAAQPQGPHLAADSGLTPRPTGAGLTMRHCTVTCHRPHALQAQRFTLRRGPRPSGGTCARDMPPVARPAPAAPRRRRASWLRRAAGPSPEQPGCPRPRVVCVRAHARGYRRINS